MSKKRWTITFSPLGEGEYQVAIRRPGSVHRFKTKLPPDISDLWVEPETADGTVTQRSFRSGDLASLSPEQRFFQAANLPTLKDIGERVLESIFDLKNGTEGPKLLGALEDRISDNDGVEIEFDLSETAELSAIPWESVYLPSRDRFLAIGTTSNLVRRLDAQSELPEPIERPIRILVAAANPRDDLNTDVELGNIQRRISELVSEDSDTFEIQSLPEATRDDFRRKVLEWKPHIVHYIGHSAFKDGKGYLYFEGKKEGESDKVSAETLRNMLLNQRPWLVVLNSCQSGQTSSDAPMAGVAQNLLQRLNIPFVVAMQQPVSDDAAINFSQDFYTSLTSGESVANAVSNGRCAIANDDHPLTQLELITPALYTSGEAERIAFVEEAAPAAVAGPTTDDKKDADKGEGFLGGVKGKIVLIGTITAGLAGILTNVENIYESVTNAIGGPDVASTEAPSGGGDGGEQAGNGNDGSGQGTEGGLLGGGPNPPAGPPPTGSSGGFAGSPEESEPVTNVAPQIERDRVIAARPAPGEDNAPFVWPAAGSVISIGGLDYLVTADSAVRDGIEIPRENVEALLGDNPPAPAAGPSNPTENTPPEYAVGGSQENEPRQVAASYSIVHPSALFEAPGAAAPPLELGFVEGQLPEPNMRRDFQDYLAPAITSDQADFYRIPVHCAGRLNTLFFEHDERVLAEDQAAFLQDLLPAMACPRSKLVIAGFTDTTGSDDYNDELAIERAVNVAEAIIETDRANVLSVHAVSYGEDENAVDAGQNALVSENRRAEIYLSGICLYNSQVTANAGDFLVLEDTPPPYPGPNAAGELTPIYIAYNQSRTDNRSYEEIADELNFYVDQLVDYWDLPRGAIFPMIYDDWCLKSWAMDEYTGPSRIDISYGSLETPESQETSEIPED